MQILVTIALVVIAVLLFELIIGLHEFGHFITAKLSGIKVNEFALGMGPKLFSFKKGETQYSLRLFQSADIVQWRARTKTVPSRARLIMQRSGNE